MTQGGTATFKYDPFGRRIQKVFTQNSTTTTTNYLYGGDNAIETVDQSGTVLAKFAQGQNIDEPLAESVGGTTYDYEQDGLGSATSLTNSSGALALTYTYDSFGKVTASSGSVSNPFRYTGRDFDSETGLYYYRARYYDPTTGRYLSEDSVSSSSEANLYIYVNNSPVIFVDPLGLCQLTPGMKRCLGTIFNTNVSNVKIIEKLNPTAGYIATTRKNRIIITIPCSDFLNDPDTVLHEYYHVLEQWGKMRLFWLRYGWQYLLHGYKNNKYEKKAGKFAKDHKDEYEKCLACGQ